MILRRFYIEWMRRRGKHVKARDCWCNPERISFKA